MLEGVSLRLRPVGDSDVPFIVRLRNDPGNSRHLHAGARTVAAQLAWLDDYYRRAGDFYFVIERTGKDQPEGLVAIYDVDPAAGTGEWGRWIQPAESLGAVEGAWLAWRAAFECLHLREACCRTLARNEPVVSFHDSFGISRRTRLEGHFLLEGQRLDAIEHRLTADEWPVVSARIEPLVRRLARRLSA